MKQRNKRKILAAKSYARCQKNKAALEWVKVLRGFTDAVEGYLAIMLEKLDTVLARKKAEELQSNGS